MDHEFDDRKDIPETGSGYVPSVDLEDQTETDTEQPDQLSTPPDAPQEPVPDPAPDPEQNQEQNQPEPTEDKPTEKSSEPVPPGPKEEKKPEPEQPAQQEKTKRKPRKLFVVLSSIFIALAVCAIGAISYVYFVIEPYESYDKIMPNVYCAGVNLGGMTVKEAQSAIEEALSRPSNRVTVVLPDVSFEFCPAQEGVTLNGEKVAQRAYDYGRSDPTAFGMYQAYRRAKSTEYRLSAETELRFSAEDIEAKAQEIYEETYIAPTEPTAQFDAENHTVTLAPGAAGREIPAETIAQAVEDAFERLDFSDIQLEYDPIDVDLVALRELTRQCAQEDSSEPVEPVETANAENHTIDVTMGMPGYTLDDVALFSQAKAQVESGEYQPVTLALTEVLPRDVDITGAYHELACDATEPYYYNGDVQEGSDGYTLDWEMAVDAIVNTPWGETVSVPMTAIPPQKTAEEVRAVLFRDQLSTFSSPHTANADRTTNLTLCCKAINGTVINPGETFSFNSVVGERTAAKGYKKATVYVGNESVGETGGGICQVASTIYDAVLYADLQVTERAPHTFFVTYVSGGLDATVYWGSQDFCFKNDTEYPIRVDAWVSGGYVNISIYGTKTNDNYVKLDYTKLSTTPYSTVNEYTSSLPSGTSKEKTYPYTGYVYEAYQYVYSGDGTLLETNYLGKSTYKKRDRVMLVGTG